MVVGIETTQILEGPVGVRIGLIRRRKLLLALLRSTSFAER
jgi:hypothetical protein